MTIEIVKSKMMDISHIVHSRRYTLYKYRLLFHLLEIGRCSSYIKLQKPYHYIWTQEIIEGTYDLDS